MGIYGSARWHKSPCLEDWREIQRVVAIRRHIFVGPDNLDRILAHVTANAPVPDIEAQLI
jgi:hypothetical protein